MDQDFIELLHRRQNREYSYPDKESAEDFVNKLFDFLFHCNTTRNSELQDIKKDFVSLQSYLDTLIYSSVSDKKTSGEASRLFFEKLPVLYDGLIKDAETISSSDPAATSTEEVLNAYPGFFAIAVYRVAHVLYNLHLRHLARLFTEYAHRQTGIDIHPGAVIGSHFFIDHGTGIVIGETSVIGHHVKIYQGVTIGAFFGQDVRNEEKRHPTIEDNVIIYANATILGGSTVIGKESIIGANVCLTESVPARSFVYQKNEVVPVEIHVLLKSEQVLSA